MENKLRRYRHQIKNNQIQFSKGRRVFQLDRLINQYETKQQTSNERQGESKDHPNAYQQHYRMIPQRMQIPVKKRRKVIQLIEKDDLNNSNKLIPHLRLKTISTRYKGQVDSPSPSLQHRSLTLETSIPSQEAVKLYQRRKISRRNKNSSMISIVSSSKEEDKSRKNISKEKIKWSYRTRKGYNPLDPNKPNQDEYLVKIYKQKKQLFAIADGHGPNGHLVSQFVVNRLENMAIQMGINEQTTEDLSKVYNRIQDQLYKTNVFDVNVSGTTLLTILVSYPILICANVGDSRAILARKPDKCDWEIVNLSEDHKPSLPKQRKRILKKGGRIHAIRDEEGFTVGPLRVWLPSKDYPGLAMSRSLGDNIHKCIGVTHEPDVMEIQIESADKFLIIGSDGVWDAINYSQILKFIVPLYSQGKLEQCSDTLMQLCISESIKRPMEPIDDITFIIVFLNRSE